ncbi:SDR family NAD(P)-dependent oxidoreductase [Candidatus Nitrosocosmicus hydrocola]|uniref:SDR family NAD(P)-dependent oxidoreductase n=1 Tax=Candidatus Nitrosocosmicus hydrocola TaxID=1826872 RepID=UPI0011E5FD2D|nr:SDR family oxidoreductase [Candidatus Nitrosocosmicus hydrocola]
MSLKGKVVIVTGSSKGIGFEIAKEFSESNGAHVVVCSRSLEQSQMAAKKIKGSTLALEVDVTNESSVNKFVEKITEKFNRINILVNNSGYPYDESIWNKQFHEGTTDELWKILDVDLIGAVRLSRAVIPHMLNRNVNQSTQNSFQNKNEVKGDENGIKIHELETVSLNNQEDSDQTNGGGVIITISSTPAISGRIGGFPYTIAKAGNISLTKCIAKEYGNSNIRAYSLALGNIATKATYEAITQEVRIEAAQEAPMKRWGKPAEVAKVAACIADDNFSFATGNTIVIDGGTVLL